MRNRTWGFILCCLAALTLTLPLAGRADDAVKEIAALAPVVQTADWAQSWWMPRHKQKLDELKTRGQIDLLMIGDSITHGWENGKALQLWDRYYGKRKALNLGFSGDRTEHVLWRFENGEIDGISPKLAIVMIGTNNAGHRQEESKDTAAGIEEIVEQLRTRLPRTKILLLAIFPRGKDADDELRKLNDATNGIVAKLADGKSVFYLDIGASFLEDGGVLPKSIMPDLLHPNEKGYAIWAEAIEPSVKRLMGEK